MSPNIDLPEGCLLTNFVLSDDGKVSLRPSKVTEKLLFDEIQVPIDRPAYLSDYIDLLQPHAQSTLLS